MIFPTVEFAIFFTVVLALSWALMPYPLVWKPFILIASYIFYGAAGWKFCVLLAIVTVGNQAAAALLMRTEPPQARKAIVVAAVGLDLGVLGVFKYYGFFATQINGALDAFGLGFSAPLVALAIPLGVSFFTFQAISYVVDVYRRTIEAGNLLDVALYLSFFSHIVAGPIVRAREFLPQLATPRSPRDIPVGAAVGLIALGLIKKVAIADFLARTVVDPVFAVPQAYHAQDVALASYAYAAQIFCDFSGYTDIAIGTALLMGFVFPQNFHRPYGALGFQQFWRSWHMTLSRFLRDFLYIPLGGSRGSRLFTARNRCSRCCSAGCGTERRGRSCCGARCTGSRWSPSASSAAGSACPRGCAG
jgi:alginate O-acetyltransferase complex protein AlgI